MKLRAKAIHRLPGSRCPRCGHVTYPVESICSVCGSLDEKELIELGPEGILYTFTVVYAATPRMETPYALGYVDFVEGARVFGRIVPRGALAVGISVHAVLGPDGDTFWFEPIGEGKENT